MIWLNNHREQFFKLSGILLCCIVFFGIWIILHLFGFSGDIFLNWSKYQHKAFVFLWEPVIITNVVFLVLAFLSFKEKFFIFPIISIFLIFKLPIAISSISQISYGDFSLFYIRAELWGIFVVLEFVISILGTILWIRRIRNNTKNRSFTK